MRTAVGGSFDHLHRGHRLLLRLATRGASLVAVGVASDALTGGRCDQDLSTRKESVSAFLDSLDASYTIEVLEDPLGSAATGDYERIVCSPETVGRCDEINAIRSKAGLEQLTIDRIDHARAQDGDVLSSTRIRGGVCDINGLMTRPLKVRVGSENPVKVGAVEDALSALPGVWVVEGVAVDSGSPEQPLDTQTIKGARTRARAALGDADYGIGIEAGIWSLEEARLDIQACVVVDRSSRETVGSGPGFAYPEYIMDLVDKGRPVGEAVKELTGIEDVGRHLGTVHMISHGWLDRRTLTYEAVRAALLPRMDDLLGGNTMMATHLITDTPTGARG